MPYSTSNNNLSGVSIIIPTHDQVELLKQCINSILKKTDYPLSAIEIIVINNQSQQTETLTYLSELSSFNFIRIIDYDSSFNFSAMNNLAVKLASNDIICLLNNDIEVITPDWLSEMAHFLVRDNIGCVGAKLYYPNNTIQHAGVVLGINGVAGHIYKHCPRETAGYDNHLLHARYYSAVTAACMMVKRTLYLETGGFDENLAVAYNDVDFCIKLSELGYKHVWTPRAELYHHESASRGTHKQRTRTQQRRFKKEVNYMKKKWGNRLINDPLWSPNWPLTESWCGQLIDHSSVFIVLATYNGVEYIAQQLDSLLEQSSPCHIYIFDDGSTDGTVELIQANYLQYGNLHLSVNKTRLGYVKNFEQGVKHVYELGAQYLALCDQDDIWHPRRIEKMVKLIAKKNSTPTLVYNDLQMMDTNRQILHPSYLQYRGYTNRSNLRHSLATTLGQNGVMGNSSLINRALVKRILPFPEDLHSHDYWISLVAQLCGQCIFIPEPLVSYRIHSSNASNSTQALAGSPPKHLTKIWQQIQKRDYRLPYKEDSRDQVLTFFFNQADKNRADLSSNRLIQDTSERDRALISGFLHYLNFDKPRWYLAYWMLRHKFIRRGWKHKLRFIYRILVTARYN